MAKTPDGVGPRWVKMTWLERTGAIIVETERAGLYCSEPAAAWQIAGQLVDRRLDVPPQGNC